MTKGNIFNKLFKLDFCEECESISTLNSIKDDFNDLYTYLGKKTFLKTVKQICEENNK